MARAKLSAGAAALAMASVLVAGEAAGPTMADLEGCLAKVPAFQYGESRAALADAERMIPPLAQDAAQRKAIEKRLIALLTGEGTNDGKAFVCRQLSFVGSAEAVPSLAKLLPDKEMSHHARIALERMPCAEAVAALRDALGKVQGALLVGVMNSLGERRDAASVPALIKLASDADEAVAEAAVAALGKIGGADAAKAIAAVRTKASDKLRPAATDAYLLCADGLVAAGKKAEAAAIYKEVYDGEKKEHLRVAAFRGLLATGDEVAWALIIKTLSTDDPKMWGTAAQFAREIPGTEATKALAAALGRLAPPAQVLLLGALTARGDGAALPAVLDAAKSKEESVRVAALGALGRFGNASCVPLLAGLAAKGQGAEQGAARKGLVELRGNDIDPALIAAAGVGEAAIRTELIRILAARNTAAAVPMLLKAAEDADKAIRSEAMNALGVLADAKALPALVKLLVEAKADDERANAEKAVVATCRRVEDKEAATAPVLAPLPGPSAAVRCALLRVLAKVPSAKGLEALRAAVKDADASVKDVAIRGLADWPDAAPMPDLITIARTAESPVHKVLALRGLIRMAALPSERPAEQTAKLLADALALATTPDDKKLVLAALANVNHQAALDLAVGCLSDAAIEVEAATAVVQIAKNVRKTNRDAAKAALQKVLDVCKTPAARQSAESALLVVDSALNIAPQGTATSPDGHDSDGGAGGDQAAIDGDPNTYWDEADGQKLYRLVVTFKQPEKIGAISILGYQHHQYAPKDFEILCDDKVVKKVENAQYDDNFLVIALGELTAKTVELKITGTYGKSPAIRELGIYPPGGKMLKMETPKKK
ncbi:MAG TPA: HEAT repeat domain-containing protein [Planctomycetota bacterium]|nr:HEAT repeat domain-containing protein [Planctomycetota bacterium]